MPVAVGIELYLNLCHSCFQGAQPWTLQDFTVVQYFPFLNHCLCIKGFLFNQRPVLVAGVFTLWPSILFLGGDSGFQYLLAVAVPGPALPRTDATDSGGPAASPLFKGWLHSSARIHCHCKPHSGDKEFRVWSHCRPALETSCNCFSSLLHPQFC